MATTSVDFRVVRNDELPFPTTGRRGTLFCPEALLVRAIGDPSLPSTMDAKVTKEWRFETPRGVVTVYDYWWNVAGIEWSLSANDVRALIWLRRLVKAEAPSALFVFRLHHGMDRPRDIPVVRAMIAEQRKDGES